MTSVNASAASGTRELTFPMTFDVNDTESKYAVTFNAQKTPRGAINPQSTFATVRKISADASSAAQTTTITVNNILFQNPENENRSFATLNLNQQLGVLRDAQSKKRKAELFLDSHPAHIIFNIVRAPDSDDDTVMYHDATAEASHTGAALSFAEGHLPPPSRVNSSDGENNYVSLPASPSAFLPLPPDEELFRFGIQRADSHEPFVLPPAPESPSSTQYPASLHTTPPDRVPDVEDERSDSN